MLGTTEIISLKKDRLDSSGAFSLTVREMELSFFFLKIYLFIYLSEREREERE